MAYNPKYKNRTKPGFKYPKEKSYRSPKPRNNKETRAQSAANSEEAQLALKTIFRLFMYVLFLPFFLWTGIYTLIMKQQLLSENSVRINNIGMTEDPIHSAITGIGTQFLTIPIAFLFLDTTSNLLVFIYAMVLLFSIWYNVVMASWISVAYMGVIINKDKDKVYFQHDLQSFDFMDYVTLKPLRQLRTLDIVKLSDIEKVSKEYGTYTFLLGKFGSRRVRFTTKQKRDEFIYNLRKYGSSSMMFNFDIQ